MSKIAHFRARADIERHPIAMTFADDDIDRPLIEWLVSQQPFADFEASPKRGTIYAATLEDAVYLKLASDWPVTIRRIA